MGSVSSSARRLRFLVAAALVVSLAALAGPAIGSRLGLPLEPLSTLGKLKPAPAPGPQGPEGVPIPPRASLGPAQEMSIGRTIDGITCGKKELFVTHIHAHLTIFDKGLELQVPYAIGIAPPLYGKNTKVGAYISQGSCFMWLHTHAADGIIHIESPNKKTQTLGEFFDVWGQQLGKNQLGPVVGKVTAIYNDKVWTGNPRDIPLTSHAQIQLEQGKPLVAPEKITFPTATLGTG